MLAPLSPEPHPAHDLLAAVRRRMWAAQGWVAARRALWAAAALLLLAVAVHLVLTPLPVATVALALALPGIVMLARAATQRPADAACALWADRQLGGATAFSTWLEVQQGHAAPGPARAWVTQWAAAQVPACRERLAALPAPARLAKPLSAAAVCAVLAVLVLNLPGRLPAAASLQAAAAPAPAAERPLAQADTAVPATLVKDIASALRAADAGAAPGAGAGGAAAGGPAKPDAASPRAATADGSSAPPKPGEMVAADASRTGPAVNAATPLTGGTPSTGSSAGREAGDSADRRAEPEASRMQTGSLPLQTRAPADRPRDNTRQADPGSTGRYEDELARPGTAARLATLAPAATPPPATAGTRLSPTETTYVQAWLKAQAQRP